MFELRLNVLRLCLFVFLLFFSHLNLLRSKYVPKLPMLMLWAFSSFVMVLNETHENLKTNTIFHLEIAVVGTWHRSVIPPTGIMAKRLEILHFLVASRCELVVFSLKGLRRRIKVLHLGKRIRFINLYIRTARSSEQLKERSSFLPSFLANFSSISGKSDSCPVEI